MERWIKILKQELDLTAEEIADFAWLTVIRQRLEGEGVEVQSQEFEDSVAEEVNTQEIRKARDRQIPPASSIPPPARQNEVELFPESPQPVMQNATELGALKLKVDSPPSIRDPLEIIRALCPIAQKFPTGQMAELDEAATVQRIAEEGIWDAIAMPVLEPWLEVAIVVDESASMLIWRKTVLELQKIFNHYGSFRDVRIWGLVEKDEEVGILSGIGRSVKDRVIRNGQELIDPDGRRLILLVTDCVAEMWQNGAVLPMLKTLSEKQPLVMLQMLPEWLWTRTGLRHGECVRFSGREAGVANHRLKMERRSVWEQLDEQREAGIRVPVVTLEPERLQAWSRMIAGGSGETLGFLFKSEWFASAEDLDEREPELTAKERVQQFRLSTSPMARRLAGLLAATPVITLPVVRLVQETLLQKSNQVHVAEVLLGGILQPVRKVAAGENPEQVEYRFINEQIRTIFLEMAPVPETVNVLSRYVERQFRKSLDEFIAELRTWTVSEDRQLGEQARPFAIVAAEVLRRKGGKYAEFIQQVNEVYFPAVAPAVETSIPESELSTFEFEIATIEETNEELIAYSVKVEDSDELLSERAEDFCRSLSDRYAGSNLNEIKQAVSDALESHLDSLDLYPNVESSYSYEAGSVEIKVLQVKFKVIESQNQIFRLSDFHEDWIVVESELSADVSLECNFSFTTYDSIDRDEIGIGSNTITIQTDLDINVLISISLIDGLMNPNSDFEVMQVNVVEVRDLDAINWGFVEPDWGDPYEDDLDQVASEAAENLDEVVSENDNDSDQYEPEDDNHSDLDKGLGIEDLPF